jgi:hypothetical protein
MVSGCKFECATSTGTPSRKLISFNSKLADSTTGVAPNTYPKPITTTFRLFELAVTCPDAGKQSGNTITMYSYFNQYLRNDEEVGVAVTVFVIYFDYAFVTYAIVEDQPKQ